MKKAMYTLNTQLAEIGDKVEYNGVKQTILQLHYNNQNILETITTDKLHIKAWSFDIKTNVFEKSTLAFQGYKLNK
jgi:hypothetical protein